MLSSITLVVLPEDFASDLPSLSISDPDSGPVSESVSDSEVELDSLSDEDDTDSIAMGSSF